mgnify:CR=1 FL=1
MTDTLVGPSRRSFVRAAAWTVPVVSMVAAAPAFAPAPMDFSKIAPSKLKVGRLRAVHGGRA